MADRIEEATPPSAPPAPPEVDTEGVMLCVLLVASFGAPLVVDALGGHTLTAGTTACALVAGAAALVLLRVLFERLLAR